MFMQHSYLLPFISHEIFSRTTSWYDVLKTFGNKSTWDENCKTNRSRQIIRVSRLVSGAIATNTISVTGISPSNVQVQYSCDVSAGIKAIEVSVSNPQADSSSASGRQNKVTCTNAQQTAVVELDGAMSQGQVQVRAALVTGDDTVGDSTTGVLTLG